MRAVCSQTVMKFPSPDAETFEDSISAAQDLISRWKDHPLIVPSVAPHAPYTCTPEMLLASVDLAWPVYRPPSFYPAVSPRPPSTYPLQQFHPDYRDRCPTRKEARESHEHGGTWRVKISPFSPTPPQISTLHEQEVYFWVCLGFQVCGGRCEIERWWIGFKFFPRNVIHVFLFIVFLNVNPNYHSGVTHFHCIFL